MDPFTLAAVGMELMGTVTLLAKAGAYVSGGVKAVDEIAIRRLPEPLQESVRKEQKLFEHAHSYARPNAKNYGLVGLADEVERDDFGDEIVFIYALYTGEELIEVDQLLAEIQGWGDEEGRGKRAARGKLKALVRKGKERMKAQMDMMDKIGWQKPE